MKPFTPYQLPDPLYVILATPTIRHMEERYHWNPERFNLQGYEDEKQMLDGMKTIAAVNAAIERPRAHYFIDSRGLRHRLNNTTNVWEPFQTIEEIAQSIAESILKDIPCFPKQ